MLCSRCKKAEASVFFKVIVDNRISESALCLACAAETQQPVEGAPPLFGFMDLLGAAEPPPREPCCRACGLRFAEFRANGRLGCPACYEGFAAELAGVLERFHGAKRHKGKRPPDTDQDLPELKKSLDEAVKGERYEEAAKLRDRIKKAQGECS